MKLNNLLKIIGATTIGFLPIGTNAEEAKGFIFGSLTLPSSGIPAHYKAGFGIGGGANIPINEVFSVRLAGEYGRFKGDETVTEERKLFRTERTEYLDHIDFYAAEFGLTYNPTEKVYLSAGGSLGNLSNVSGIEKTGSRDNISLKSSEGRTGNGFYSLVGFKPKNLGFEMGIRRLSFNESEEKFSSLFARLAAHF